MQKKNILVLTYWSYKDALIQTYTLPYVRIIRKIINQDSDLFFVTHESKFHSIAKSEKKKILKDLDTENISWISNSYSPLGIFSFFKNSTTLFKLWWLCRTKRITHIHAWCTPAGSLGYILSILTSIPLIIDSYEPHAEAMVENGTWKKNSIPFKLLFHFEKLLSKHATTTIATSEGMKFYALEKYNIELGNFYTKPACVDFNLFASHSTFTKKEENKIICVYAGKFGGIYLSQEIFDFFKVAHTYWGGKFKILILTNALRNEIEKYAAISQLDSSIIISKYVNHDEIPNHLALADFAINPVKPVPTKKYCTSIKDGEYWAMGLPVVIPSNIADDSGIIEQYNIGAVLPSLDNESYLSAVKQINSLLHSPLLDKKKTEIREIAQRFRGFKIAEDIYKKLYQDRNE
jgi:hypothetical protein